ncbi:MAG: outer membrane lipoprotein-sorting protein, partial [Steroidobacteraceae bacterium]
MRTLIPSIIAGVVLLTLAVASAGAQAARLDAQSILAASDLIRNPQKPSGFSIALVEYRDGRELDSDTLAIYSKLDVMTGTFRTLVRYVAPARDAGKLVLESGTEMWFYDPSSEA